MFKYYAYKLLRGLRLISKEKYAEKRLKYGYKKTKDYKAIARSPLFDAQWYLEHNPDVKAAGEDPIMHYLIHGWKENRPCTPYFDGRQYLEMYPDVAQANMNPLLHRERYGQFEDRYAEIKGKKTKRRGRSASFKEKIRQILLYPIELQQEVERLEAEVEQLRQGR